MPKKRISLLPEHLIDQIKAGEVIERPSSVLKELVENAIDSKASKIDVEIDNCGLNLIKVVDNGGGMNEKELPMAFCRHATSKIENFEDLYSLFSFGFRGEALASLCSISRLSCFSSPQEDLGDGGKIVFHGGEQVELAPYHGHSSGSAFYVRDLFYNTPARFKFVKSQISEKNALRRIFDSFLLGHPEISFSLKFDSEDKEIYPACDNQKKRVEQVFFKSQKSSLKVDQYTYEQHSLKAFISEKSSKSTQGKKHFLFVNGRLFFDRQLHQILINILTPFWGKSKTGHYALFFTLPPSKVDVNVHPNKTTVKFLKRDYIISLLKTLLKNLSDNLSVDENKSRDNFQEIFYDAYDSPDSADSADYYDEKKEYKDFQRNLKTSQSELESSVDFFSFSSRVKGFNREGKSYLVHAPLFLRDFFSQYFSRNYESEELTPLLICEPFEVPSVARNGPSSSILLTLKKKGIELELVDRELLGVKSILDVFYHFNLKVLLNFILINISQGRDIEEKSFFTDDQLEEISGTVNLKELLKIDGNFEGIKSVQDIDLESFFK